MQARPGGRLNGHAAVSKHHGLSLILSLDMMSQFPLGCFLFGDKFHRFPIDISLLPIELSMAASDADTPASSISREHLITVWAWLDTVPPRDHESAPTNYRQGVNISLLHTDSAHRSTVGFNAETSTPRWPN
jgi:hypothetical protein